jgi:ribonuclease HI
MGTNMLPEKLSLYFDGSIKGGNPGGTASYAFQLLDENGQEVGKGNGIALKGEGATNNIAEWAGVVAGLRYLKAAEWNGQLTIYGDSELVINQLLKFYQCKKETLVPYYKEAQAILENMNWDAKWVGRENNSFCDQYSREVG